MLEGFSFGCYYSFREDYFTLVFPTHERVAIVVFYRGDLVEMEIDDIGEFGFIQNISTGCISRSNGVIKGIGDDAAVFLLERDHATLVTTDLLVEGIHFLRDSTDGFDLGFKAMAVNLSDIAAMGGIAREAFVSIAIPEHTEVSYLISIYDGMKELAACHEVNILGGDTTRSLRHLVINITVVGSAPQEGILFRSGAKEGDLIFVSGFLGNSRAGLEILLRGLKSEASYFDELIKAHLRPIPALKEGRFLAQSGVVSAAIDISDGLAADIFHIAGLSGVGAVLDMGSLPLTDALKRFCALHDLDPYELALQGGEDYVLLFTVEKDEAKRLSNDFQKSFGRPIHQIGVISSGNQVRLRDRDGSFKILERGGWDHFPKRPQVRSKEE